MMAMIIDKIIHYQVALTTKTMDELKAKTGERTATGALTSAVKFRLSDQEVTISDGGSK